MVFPFIAIIAIALMIWVIAAYSFFNMLRHVRSGNWIKLLFQMGWWNPQKIDQFIDPPGIPHYRRLIKAILWFLIAVVCGIAYGAFQISLQG